MEDDSIEYMLQLFFCYLHKLFLVNILNAYVATI